MNAAAVLPRTGFKFTIAVRSGQDAGAVYQLLPPRVALGRDPESNNVVINDPKVSRNAAVIEFSPENIFVVDLTGRGKVAVNGRTAERTSIRGGDVIRLGDTELQFVVEAMNIAAPNLPAVHHEQGFAVPSGMAPPPRQAPPNHGHHASIRTPQKGGNRGMFYMIVLLVFGGLIYVGMSDSVAKKLDRGLRTTSEIEKEISETDARVAEVTKKRSFRTEEEKSRYEEAQKHYIEGFRDYQKGNYSRAMRSFETARAIDPEHVLARRYYRQAEKQRDESVTQLLLEGRRYREKNMFARCAAAIEKALVLMPNKDDIKFKQADAMKKECDLLQDRRF